jgi:hypothetical protein
VPNTEELEEDFWIHEMCSQSHAHPSYEELETEMGPTNSEDSEFPVIVLTNLNFRHSSAFLDCA